MEKQKRHRRTQIYLKFQLSQELRIKMFHPLSSRIQGCTTSIETIFCLDKSDVTCVCLCLCVRLEDLESIPFTQG